MSKGGLRNVGKAIMAFISLSVPSPGSAEEAPGQGEQSSEYMARLTLAPGASCRVKGGPIGGALAASWSGRCANGYIDGQGSLIWKIGEVESRIATGNWTAGQMNGQMIIYWPSQKIFEYRRYELGIPDPTIGVRYQDGTQLSGVVKDSKLNGFATITSPKNVVFRAYFVNGELLYSEATKKLNLVLIQKLERVDDWTLRVYRDGRAIGTLFISPYCPKISTKKPFTITAYDSVVGEESTITVNGKACGYGGFSFLR